MTVQNVMIPPEAEGMKTGLFLRRYLPDLPESTLRKIFSARDVKLDGIRVLRDTPVHAGQTLTVFLPASANTFESLRIVWEDDNVLLVNKPAGISVEADPSPSSSASPSSSKSALAVVRPDRRSPSRTFWIFPRPAAIPRLPFALKP